MPKVSTNVILLLTPSWLSSYVLVLFGICLIGLPILLTRLHSTFALLPVFYRPGVDQTAAVVGNALAQNKYLDNLPFFTFWALVGLASFLIVRTVVDAYAAVQEVRDQFGYVNADRRTLQQELRLHIAIRVGAVVGWWFLVRYLLYHLAPYAIAASHVTGLHLTDLHDWQRTVLASLAAVLALHGLTVLLRLIALRPRLFVGEAALPGASG